MEKLAHREHDFGTKLRQESAIQRLREYIAWQRGLRTNPGQEPPLSGPLSVNLDLTMACNFSCPHCVDSTILNHGKSLSLKNIRDTIETLHSRGLLSVILLGGGEPTLHKDFEKVVRTIKDRGLQLGVVTNGSRLDRVMEVADLLQGKDWVRLSLDAAREETFQALHRPRTGITLKKILSQAKKLKEKNEVFSLGYSFVIVWEGIVIQGRKLKPNVEEMEEAVYLAGQHLFDYISFKPCLVRLEFSQRESLLDHVDKEEEKKIAGGIRVHLEKARTASGERLKILESVNLKAMLNLQTETIKRQPPRCHMPFFRTVVSPSGIFHCPAFRGVDKARIADPDGYVSALRFDESLRNTAASILSFKAEEECNVVGCFYHDTNWWLEEFIHSNRDLVNLLQVEDDNFFL
jgi:MoaA/NifB/PqqE/SkfB family radical SAM enzyme